MQGKEVWAEGKAGLQGSLRKDVVRRCKAGMAIQGCSGLGQGSLTDQSLDVGWSGKGLCPWVRHLSPAQAVPLQACSHIPRSNGSACQSRQGVGGAHQSATTVHPLYYSDWLPHQVLKVAPLNILMGFLWINCSFYHLSWGCYSISPSTMTQAEFPSSSVNNPFGLGYFPDCRNQTHIPET